MSGFTDLAQRLAAAAQRNPSAGSNPLAQLEARIRAADLRPRTGLPPAPPPFDHTAAWAQITPAAPVVLLITDTETRH